MSETDPNAPDLTNYERHLLSIKESLKPTEDPSTGDKIDLVLDSFNALSSNKKLLFDYKPFETVLTPDVLPYFLSFLNTIGLEVSIPEENRTLIQFRFDNQEGISETKDKAITATRIGLEKIIEALVYKK